LPFPNVATGSFAVAPPGNPFAVATTDKAGNATAPTFTANGIAGTYSITTSIYLIGGATPVTITRLTNLPQAAVPKALVNQQQAESKPSRPDDRAINPLLGSRALPRRLRRRP